MAPFDRSYLTDPYNLQRLCSRHRSLRMDQSSYRQHWRIIRDFMAPRRGRYLEMDTDESPIMRGLPKGAKEIINGVAYDATRTLGAGLQGGLTSPARPWFILGLDDDDLAKYPPVADWLTTVRDIILRVMSRSNFYESQHGNYEELSLFGTAAMFIEEDMNTVVRCRPFTIGEFCIALDATLRPNTLYRQLSMSAESIAEKFPNTALPPTVQNMLDNGKYDTRFEVVHAVEPNKRLNPRSPGPDGMLYTSVYFMPGEGQEYILSKKGYSDRPFVASRWDAVAADEYGNSPGMFALGDDKMLQKMEEKKLRGLDKHVDPPMNAPTSMKNIGGTVVPGGINFLDTTPGGQSFTPSYQVNPDITSIGQEIMRVEARIKRFFYNDLFLSVTNETKRMTATETAQRYEEKLIMLGPVLERLQGESLDPVIERFYTIINRLGGFPPPPPELGGRRVSVTYVSMLAQAQKMVGSQSIEQAASFVGAVAPLDPKSSLRFNADEAVQEYLRMSGVNPKMIRSDDEVAKLVAAQQLQAQQQQMAANAEPLAKAAKAVGSTTVNGQNLLAKITGQQ